ncbi:MAG: sodium:proton antiporter [Stellaceae bacterium]
MTVPTSLLWAVPFLGLLLTIACAPLLAPPLWHRHYAWWTALWSLAYILPATGVDGPRAVLDAVLETALLHYLPFILLLGALFAVAGGLRVTGTPRGGPLVNTTLLALGALLASVIGTTGAAMLAVRPLVRANRHRRHRRHVFVFLVLLVANVGGALTPLGDPPIFLGFLAGVPFFWPLVHLWAPTALVAGGLLGSFYALDRYLFQRHRGGDPPLLPEIEKLGLEGGVNLALLALIVGAVLLRAFWHPAAGLTLFGFRWDAAAIAADALLLAAALLSLALTPRQTRRRNDFAWAPMTEVAILFAGIFITILPVMAMISAGPAGPAAALFDRLMSDGVPDDRWFYWATGLSSAILDNAPTYLVFFGFAGDDAAHLTAAVPRTLAAISAAATFFGALTYLGNAPNLLIKRLAEQQGIAMPNFFGYIGWALVCLLPWLLLVQLIFFA